MTVLPMPAPGEPGWGPDDQAVAVERVAAGVSDAPDEVISCGRAIMLMMHADSECFTIQQLRDVLPDSNSEWIAPTLAFLEVDGYVNKHMPDDGDAMHYFLTEDGAERIQAN